MRSKPSELVVDGDPAIAWPLARITPHHKTLGPIEPHALESEGVVGGGDVGPIAQVVVAQCCKVMPYEWRKGPS